MKRAISLLGVMTLAACGVARTPGTGGMEDRCKMGLDMFEQGRCRGAPQGALVQHVRMELEGFEQQCKDPASVARIKRLEGTCMVAYRGAQEGERVSRRKLRARYVPQISELLVDPAYPPAYDAYKELEERVFQGDSLAKQQIGASRATLAELARKHGLDPSLSQDLQLW